MHNLRRGRTAQGMGSAGRGLKRDARCLNPDLVLSAESAPSGLPGTPRQESCEEGLGRQRLKRSQWGKPEAASEGGKPTTLVLYEPKRTALFERTA